MKEERQLMRIGSHCLTESKEMEREEKYSNDSDTDDTWMQWDCLALNDDTTPRHPKWRSPECVLKNLICHRSDKFLYTWREHTCLHDNSATVSTLIATQRGGEAGELLTWHCSATCSLAATECLSDKLLIINKFCQSILWLKVYSSWAWMLW